MPRPQRDIDANRERHIDRVAGFGPLGWLDDDHVIFAAGADNSSDLEPGTSART